MNKNEFLAQLRSKLRGLPADEVETALAYYDEYFDEAGEQNEQSVIAGLGSPSEVASKIIGDFAVKSIDNKKTTTKTKLNIIWIIILGIFASPIALPLAIAATAVVFALVVTVFSLIVALAVTAGALVLGGVGTLVAAMTLLFSDFATGIFFIGVALLMGAVGLIFLTSLGYLSKTAFNGIARLFAGFLKRGK